MVEHAVYDISLSADHMLAYLNRRESDASVGSDLTPSHVSKMLEKRGITYGIDQTALEQLSGPPDEIQFPLLMAQGTEPIAGSDGEIVYQANLTTEINEPGMSFRDIMRIPTAKKGEKIATLIPPFPGHDGKTILNQTIKARHGKPHRVKAGKNIVYKEADQSFYAVQEGQISIGKRYIHIQPVYHVDDELSMKTGNLDFVGTIVIHGNVPAGYNLKAGGDIKVFGLVEAANLIAGGSIYISEGIAGQSSGQIQANESIHTGYVNQGIVKAGISLYVDTSILHSSCAAGYGVHCSEGNIIGGVISSGFIMEAKTIGNHMNSRTTVLLGPTQSQQKRYHELSEQKKNLQAKLKKVTLLGVKLSTAKEQSITLPDMNTMMHKQQHAYEQIVQQLEDTKENLLKISSLIEKNQDAVLSVYDVLYSNVIISFGKYTHTNVHNRQAVSVRAQGHEIQFNHCTPFKKQ